MIHPKTVVVEDVTPQGVTVRFGQGITDTMFLSGVCRPTVALKVGDEGTVAYRTSRLWGLWFWEDNNNL
jgi:hypothetical protein